MNHYQIMKKTGILVLSCLLLTQSMYVPSLRTNTVCAAESTTTEDSSSSEDTTISSAEVSIRTTEDSYEVSDGTLVKTIKYERPILAGTSKAIRTINKFYARLQARWISESKADVTFLESEPDFYQADFFTPYGDEVTTKVTYNRNGIISIMQQGYYYAGGAHGSPYRICHTFDLNTGEELTLSDILAGEEDDIKNTIVSLFKKKIKSMDYTFEDALETVENTAGSSSNFYLNKNSIIFYYEPYDLAPYAVGYVQTWIKYAKTAAFKLDLQ